MVDKAAYKRAWYLKNRDRILAARASLRAQAGHAEYQHEIWVRRKADKVRLRAKYNQGISMARALRAEIVRKLGSVCCKCGFADERALQIDHVNGGGSAHRTLKGRSGRTYYKSILEDLDFATKYQLLCANCNWIKRYEAFEVKRLELV